MIQFVNFITEGTGAVSASVMRTTRCDGHQEPTWSNGHQEPAWRDGHQEPSWNLDQKLDVAFTCILFSSSPAQRCRTIVRRDQTGHARSCRSERVSPGHLDYRRPV